MYTCIVPHSVLAKSYKKLSMLVQGTCTLAVLQSMQPEHNIPEIIGTVLKHIKTLFMHHISSCQLRGKSRTVH